MKNETFWSWLWNVRISRLLLVIVPCFIFVPALTYWVLTASLETRHVDRDSADVARKVLGLIEFDHLSGPELKQRIDELLRIKGSVQSELQKLELKRQVILADLADLTKTVETLKHSVAKEEKQLDKLKASIQQTRLAQLELIERNTPEVKPPLPILPGSENYRLRRGLKPGQLCDLESCYDFSRCSITSRLRVYLYQTNSPVREKLKTLLQTSGYLDENPDTACLYIFVADQTSILDKPPTFSALSHWRGDGRNHLVFNAHLTEINSERTERAMIAQAVFERGIFRQGYDLILPEMSEKAEEVWTVYPSMVPITRKFLLSFHGELSVEEKRGGKLPKVDQTTELIVQHLERMRNGQTKDEVSLSFACSSREFNVDLGDWFLCGDASSRFDILEQSTFNLVIALSNSTRFSSRAFRRRLFEALRTGNIPVILGGSSAYLPLAEVIDWNRFAVILPRQRIPELHYLLRTFSYSDLFNMKRQGRLVFENYFSSMDRVLSSLVGVIRSRLQIPANPLSDTLAPSVFNSSFSPALMDSLPPEAEPEESLGPLEAPLPSPSFRRNFTSVMSESAENWNSKFQALALFPHTPWEPLIPTEAKFRGSGTGFRPINAGEGGSGREFSQSLGGNSPHEQFTVVMLTYERESVLMSSLSRLDGLPYLNKVVVVWNSPKPPNEDLRWPDIGVPISVVKVEKNSLNNRFLPFEDIQTEAILSVDDDSHLRHDEIIFGFRVWREHRDRLVGFPGRFHAWDANATNWNYNSNYSCELSMVLTGAAFYHKYYSYLYSYSMPEAIRDMVDDLMNCEDLAMNFLISHITRQPPVKVTSRWTFRCPGCPVSLSEDDSHFQERHKCINFFSRVYGYNPLLYTQYRADSVLFKTRIPPDKQKCFKFI